MTIGLSTSGRGAAAVGCPGPGPGEDPPAAAVPAGPTQVEDSASGGPGGGAGPARPDPVPTCRSRPAPGPAGVDAALAGAATGRFRGRPPYGYRTVVEGAEGTTRTLRRLMPDETTAPVVRWIFQRYLDGCGLQGIAEELTAEAVPCPSAHDRVRNPHYGGVAWSKAAVRSILVNPRYTGRASGSGAELPAHPPLAEPDQFAQVQQAIRAKRRRPPASDPRPPYLFRGLLRCAVCSRLMQGTWNNGEPYYRCRFPEEYAAANGIAHPRNVYLRERRLVRPLDAWLTATLPPALTQSVRTGADPAAPGLLAGVARTLAALPAADAEERSRFYGWLRMRLTYSGTDPLVRVKVHLGPRDLSVRGVVSL